jgi:hypothetical protein
LANGVSARVASRSARWGVGSWVAFSNLDEDSSVQREALPVAVPPVLTRVTAYRILSS